MLALLLPNVADLRVGGDEAVEDGLTPASDLSDTTVGHRDVWRN